MATSNSKASKASDVQAQAQGEQDGAPEVVTAPDAGDIILPEGDATAPSAPAAPSDGAPQGDTQGEGDEGASEGAEGADEGDSAHVTASDIAKALGVQAKDLRRWLRASYRAAGAGDVLPGKGRRYAYTAGEASAIVAAYGKASTIKGAHRAPGLAVARVFAPSAPVAPVEGEGAQA